MKPPLLLALCHRLRDQAGDHAAISRALAESVRELEDARAVGVYLRDYAGIDKNAVILGLGSYLEIWSEEAWKQESELESSEEIEDLMVALGC